MDLSIIIVSYNTRQLTLRCIDSIVEHLGGKCGFEIIVVDNNSGDGSGQALQSVSKQRDNLVVIEERENLGFAKANNKGIRRAAGRQLLLLNSDTYLVDDSIVRAMAYLDDHETVFGCGCTLLNTDGSNGISYGAFPELGVVLVELLLGRFSKYRAVIPKRSEAIYTIDFPCGAFFLIPRKRLDAVGLLDEGFFMYCEETDLAKRAWKTGFSIVYYGPARVVHLCGQSSGGPGKAAAPSGAAIDLRKIFYQSWKRYLVKHCWRLEVVLVGFFVSLYYTIYRTYFLLLRNKDALIPIDRELNALSAGWSLPMQPIRDTADV